MKRQTALRNSAVILVLLGLIGAFFAKQPLQSEANSPISQTAGSTIDVTYGDETVRFVRDQQAMPLPPVLPIMGSTVGTFTTTHGDAEYLKILDIYLYELSSPDSGVSGVSISAWSLMIVMGHGGVSQDGIDLGSGHYQLPLAFFMPGVWEVDVSFSNAEKSTLIKLQIPVWE